MPKDTKRPKYVTNMIEDWKFSIEDTSMDETVKLALINGFRLSIEMAYDYGFNEGRYPPVDMGA